jgi:arginyl-tRNA synthetase
MNVAMWLAKLVAAHGGEAALETIELRRKREAAHDVRLFFRDGWLASAAGRNLQRELSAGPAVTEVRPRQATLSLRLGDAFIAALGRELEDGQTASLGGGDLLAGRCFAVGMVWPNTAKALHLGHLRNITLGHALAAALSAAGARALRQNLMGDIGRQVCEAMAGVSHSHGWNAPLPEGIKPDHVVSQCYSRYLREHYHGPLRGEVPDDPIGRENDVSEDLADRLMQRWMSGDPEVRDQWRQLQKWVQEGHTVTLKRLGVTIDRNDYESAHVDAVAPLMAEGLCKGTFTRGADGSILYRNDHGETMLLVRKDGLPTEHARLVAAYCAWFDEWQTRCVLLVLSGSEWQPALTLQSAIRGHFRPPAINDMIRHLYYGMVTRQSAEMHSSSGQAILIDDLLDRLVAAGEARSEADRSEGMLSAATVADMVLKGYFLCRPMTRPVEFSWDLLVRAETNPGWLIVRAWRQVLASARRAAGTTVSDEVGYRWMVLRSQDFRGHLQHTSRTYTVSGLVNYLLDLCKQVVMNPPDDRRDRVARAVLLPTLRSLGLVPPENG